MASAASAQLYVITGTLNGTGVKAEFNFTINDLANTVKVDVNNAILGIGGAKGTITAFGFNTPFSDVQLGANGSAVTITSQTINNVASSWVTSDPWTLNPALYSQEFGVSTDGSPDGGNPNNGILWGQTASFLFTFPDFGAADVANFIGQNGLSVRFQQVNMINPSEKAFGGPGGGGGGGGGAVPEPSTYGLFAAMALLGLMVARHMRRS